MYTQSMNHRPAMTHDQIARYAPSVFAQQPHDGVSDKYRFIPTFEILKTLESQGWQCVQAGEHNVRLASKKGFQKHMLRFRNPSLPKIADSEVDLVLYNSHDRTTGFKFAAGVYRFVCANGLMAGENLFQPVSVKHIGYQANDAIEASYRIIESVPQITQSIESMQQIPLLKEERVFLAQAAMTAKYGEDAGKFRPESALVVRRTADAMPTLWNTFNVIQENLIKGGVSTYRLGTNGQPVARMKTRGVSSITENSKLNMALWTLAEAMKSTKVA